MNNYPCFDNKVVEIPYEHLNSNYVQRKFNQLCKSQPNYTKPASAGRKIGFGNGRNESLRPRMDLKQDEMGHYNTDWVLKWGKWGIAE